MEELHGEIWGDMGRYGETWGDHPELELAQELHGEIWGDMGRYGETIRSSNSRRSCERHGSYMAATWR